METMKAIVIHNYGDSSVLKYEDMPLPKIQEPNDMLVRVRKSGVSPFDLHVRNGWYKEMSFCKVPCVMGCELSGDIVAIGDKVTRFQIGNPIFAYLDYERLGSYAEYVLVKEDEAVFKPESVSYSEAAASTMNALTAWQALFDVGKLSKGQTVLIHAAAGGIGHLAVQLAKIHGAYVIGTASEKNKEFLYSLGVDKFIDYKTESFEKMIQNVDVVLDTIGGDTLKKSFLVTKENGIVVSVIDFDGVKEASKYKVRGESLGARPNFTQLTQIADLLKTEKLKANIEKIFPLEQVKKAHLFMESKEHSRGKVLLDMDQN